MFNTHTINVYTCLSSVTVVVKLVLKHVIMADKIVVSPFLIQKAPSLAEIDEEYQNEWGSCFQLLSQVMNANPTKRTSLIGMKMIM